MISNDDRSATNIDQQRTMISNKQWSAPNNDQQRRSISNEHWSATNNDLQQTLISNEQWSATNNDRQQTMISNEQWLCRPSILKGGGGLKNLFVCLFGVNCPTREIFTHMETSPLPVKGCKFWTMLDTHDHCAVRVLKRATSTHLRGSVTLTPNAERLAVELSLPVFTT